MIEHLWEPKIQNEIIRALRGRRSCAQLSAKLGYSYNQLYLWESQRRSLHWCDFEKLCSDLRRPLAQTIAKYTGWKRRFDASDFLAFHLKQYAKKELANYLGVSAYTISRWLNGKTKIPMHHAISLLTLAHASFPSILDETIGRGKAESLHRLAKEKQRLLKALRQFPYLAALTPALFLKTYAKLPKHKSGVLAKAVGITESEEQIGLQILQDSGQIEFRDGKLYAKPYRLNTSNDFQYFMRCCEYWYGRAKKFPKFVGSKTQFGYRVFGLNQESYRRLVAAQTSYYHEVSEILANQSGPKDHVVALIFATMLLDESS